MWTASSCSRLRYRITSLPRSHMRLRLSSSSTQQQISQKTQDALASAKQNADKALRGAKSLGESLGGRVGNLLGSYRQPLTYNFSVAREFLKQVYVAERLAPPLSVAEIKSAYSTIFRRARQMGYWRDLVQTGEWAKVGVYALEAYGIFKIGEIIGRRSLVGYKL